MWFKKGKKEQLFELRITNAVVTFLLNLVSYDWLVLKTETDIILIFTG